MTEIIDNKEFQKRYGGKKKGQSIPNSKKHQKSAKLGDAASTCTGKIVAVKFEKKDDFEVWVHPENLVGIEFWKKYSNEKRT